MQIHIALYKWKENTQPESINKMLADIETLANKIPGIIEIVATKNISKYNEGYTHVIFVRGKDQAAINAYRSHPKHTIIAQRIAATEQHGIGVDFQTK